jgi:hypothetical protein
VLAQPTRKEPPESPARRGIDANDLPTALGVGELNLVSLDEAPAHEVDQVPSFEVPGQEELARPAFESAEIDAGAVEGDTTGLDGRDLADRDEEVSTSDLDDEAHDRWMGTVADTCNEILDSAQAVARLGVD